MWAPRGSILGPNIFVCFCFYLVQAMLMTHTSVFHLRVIKSLTKLSFSSSDMRVWMIKNKFIINYSKHDMIYLFINIGYTQILSSSNVRDICILFYKCLPFHDHISVSLLIFDCVIELFIHAFITTQLEFCSSNLYNFPNNNIE